MPYSEVDMPQVNPSEAVLEGISPPSCWGTIQIQLGMSYQS